MAGANGADNTTLTAALAYARGGHSVLPIKDDGSKEPAIPWKCFQTARATDDQLREWFGNGSRWGVGLVQGKVSGNAETIDFDDGAEETYPAWCTMVEAEAPGLLERLSHRQTAGGGYHITLRCPEVDIPGNTKLAMRPPTEAELKDKPKCRAITVVETRGEGGQVLVPGTPGHCHPSGREYVHVRGTKLSQLATITAAERDLLWRCARQFDSMPPEEPRPRSRGKAADQGRRVGDDYNERGPDFMDLLGPEGWRVLFSRGSVRHVQRPGKDGPGASATIGLRSKTGNELLCVFSTNASPFPGPEGGKPCSTHNRFDVYARLHHNGDHGEAAKALARQGYGEQRAHQGAVKPAAADIDLGGVSLRLAASHRTAGGRLSLSVDVIKGGAVIDQLPVGNSAGARRQAIELIAVHLGDNADHATIGQAIGHLFAGAAQESQAANPEGKTIRELILPVVLAKFALSYQTERGAFSESRRVEVLRPDFIYYAPETLLAVASKAVDAPRDAQGIQRAALIKAIETEMKVIWSGLLDTLPHQQQAQLGAQTASGQRFRSAMVQLWSATSTWENDPSGKGKRASLISRAVSQRKSLGDAPSRGWQRVLDAVDAWWRIVERDGGELVTLLAMRWTAQHQVKVMLPGVYDQTSLTELGTMFKVIDPNPPGRKPIRRKGRSTERVAVLAPSVTEELLDAAEDRDDEMA